MTLAFSQACENNKQPILSVLQQEFANTDNVLEIGSGTGQHAVYFAQHLPQLTWQTSDLLTNHSTITHRILQASLTNLISPIALDLNIPWRDVLAVNNKPLLFDAIFTANTLHIVSWPLVKNFFIEAGKHLRPAGKLCIYGPFNYRGKFTSQSNADFNLWLKQRDSNSGIRDFEQIVRQAAIADLSIVKDHEMPANNRLLIFTKR